MQEDRPTSHPSIARVTPNYFTIGGGMTALRASEWCALARVTLLFVMMMMTLSSGQDCTPGMITSGQVVPNTDLPTQGN